MSFNRIVCLTEETVETLYLLGQEAKIVGVTGYAIRPARVRKEKPRVGAFTSADIPRIMELRPDLVTISAGGNTSRRPPPRPRVVASQPLADSAITTFIRWLREMP